MNIFQYFVMSYETNGAESFSYRRMLITRIARSNRLTYRKNLNAVLFQKLTYAVRVPGTQSNDRKSLVQLLNVTELVFFVRYALLRPPIASERRFPQNLEGACDGTKA